MKPLIALLVTLEGLQTGNVHVHHFCNFFDKLFLTIIYNCEIFIYN
jgi:hypothetical protein